MPMCVRSAQFSGEAGGSRFLRHALTYGVAPTVMHARDWSNLCPEERAAGSEPLFPADELMRNVVRADSRQHNTVLRAGRSARSAAFELLEHRLAPSMARWVARFFANANNRRLAAGGLLPPAQPELCGPGVDGPHPLSDDALSSDDESPESEAPSPIDVSPSFVAASASISVEPDDGVVPEGIPSNDDVTFEGGGGDGEETLVPERCERPTFVEAALIQEGSRRKHGGSAGRPGSFEVK